MEKVYAIPQPSLACRSTDTRDTVEMSRHFLNTILLCGDLYSTLAMITGLEPATSCVTGKRSTLLNYTTIWVEYYAPLHYGWFYIDLLLCSFSSLSPPKASVNCFSSILTNSLFQAFAPESHSLSYSVERHAWCNC